ASVHLTAGANDESLDSHRGRIEELAAFLGPGFDAAFVNTATSQAFFGGEVAAALGIPAVLGIHESMPPSLLWTDLEPGVREAAVGAVGRAAFAVFEADATRRIFERVADPSRCLTIPYGVDFGPVHRAREGFDRAATRAAAGIAADAEVVLCLGTVEPRK